MPNPTPQQPSVAEPMTEERLAWARINLEHEGSAAHPWVMARELLAEIDRLRTENARLVERVEQILRNRDTVVAELKERIKLLESVARRSRSYVVAGTATILPARGLLEDIDAALKGVR